MRPATLLFLLFALPLTAVLAGFQSASSAPRTTAAATAPSGIETASIDRSADACTDFFQFACGGWMAANPMPADRQRWGRFNQLQDQNFAILRRILETPSSDAARKKASGYYAACMD